MLNLLSRLLLLPLQLLLFLYCCSCSHADVDTIIVTPAGSSSVETTCIDVALDNETASLFISLKPGRHVVTRFHNITNRDFFQLAGMGNASSDTVVHCEERVGLAFLNNTNVIVENLVIEECGFTDQDVQGAYGFVNESLVPTYVTPTQVQVGLFLGLCADVVFQNVAIIDTKGIGLLSYNTRSLSFDDVEVYNNTPTKCVQDIGDLVRAPTDTLITNTGGGVVLIYENFRNQTENQSVVAIRNTIFRKNIDCGLGGYLELFRSMLPSLSGSFTSNDGGGLSLLIAQTMFSVEASITNTSFIDNNSRFGSGIHIAVYQGVTDTSVNVSNCTFFENGFLFQHRHENHTSDHGGGGVAVFTDIPRVDDAQNENTSLVGTSNMFVFSDCTFANNFGLVGGALRLYHSHFTSTKVNFTLRNCILQNNTGIIGSAIALLENTGTYADSHFNLRLINSTIIHNNVVTYNKFDVNGPTSITGVLSFGEVRVHLIGDITIEGSNGTALAAKQTLITIHAGANITLMGNTGEFGGAMRLIAFTNLLLMSNATLSFINNRASAKGGALYIDVTAETIVASTGYTDCFLYFMEVSVLCLIQNGSMIPCTNISTSGVKLIFKDNKAPIAGLVYGSTLTCSWARPLLSKYPNISSVYEIVHYHYSDIFMFDCEPTSITQVATRAANLSLAHPFSDVPTLAPGEKINLTVVARDHFGQRIPAVITSRSDNYNHDASSHLDDTNFALLSQSGDQVTYLKLTETGQENTSNVTVAVSTINSPAQFHLDIVLHACELGFQYDNTSGSCQCGSNLLRNNVSCNPALGAWLVPDNNWLGPESPNSTVLILLTCNEDFCIPGVKRVQPRANNFSQQCSEGYHRTGLGCGLCENGYSQVFATNVCQKCTNISLLLIAFFALLGIVLVLALLFLPLRISEGYLNGMLLYSNIVTSFSNTLIVKQNLGSFFTFSIVSILSLDIGIELCFFDGMNALSRTGLQFVFPIYLFFLIGIFILFGQLLKLPEWFGVSIPNTFVTLLILCYSKIAAVCFDILAPTVARVITNESTTLSLRWPLDPTVHYFQGWHAPLGVLSLLLIVFYLIPFPFLLLFPFLVFKLKCLQKWKPIYDAVWNPFNPSYRGWVGFRLLFRSLPFFFARLVPAPLSLLVVGLLLLLLLYVQLILRPFKGSWNIKKCPPEDWLRNEVDSFFIGNIIFVFMGSLYFHATFDFRGRDIFVGIVVLTAYLVMAGIGVHAIVNVVRRYRRKHQARITTTSVQDSSESSEPSAENGDTRGLLVKGKTVVTYSDVELREPLLDDIENNHAPSDKSGYT